MSRDDQRSERQLSQGRDHENVQWDRLPLDPDLERDLGYRLTDWEPITTANDDGQLVYLPAEEDLLRQDAFIVVDRDDQIELIDER